MSLPEPNLDDRSYEEILDEALRLRSLARSRRPEEEESSGAHRESLPRIRAPWTKPSY